MNSTLRVLLYCIALPLIAAGMAWACVGKIDSNLREQVRKQYPSATADQIASVTVSSLAEKGAFNENSELPALYSRLKFVRLASVITAIAGLALMAGVYFAGRATRTRRDLLLRLFRPGLYITLAVVGVLTAAQAFEIAYAAYYFESIFVERVHFILILGLSVGGVLALVAVIRAMFSVFQPAEFRVIGRK
ncbi:MAG TPA: hypothetical protein VM029_06285, partial [Opitutaceae bacterium]|nr:hypothetical protein [Opitutaceae bacterium]